MDLTFEDERILQGTMGQAPKEALEMQLKVGEFYGAEQFVPVSNVHMMGDFEVMGDGGLKFLERIVAFGSRCTVPTTTNERCVDFNQAERLNQYPARVEKEKKVASLLASLGAMTIDTCIPYQYAYQPRIGEHVAWGDTGAVNYANSVLGARSNFESGPAALAAALTGRTPAYGFHLDHRRRGNILVEVKVRLSDPADWGAVGKLVGEKHQDYFTVPVFTATDQPTGQELKHLSASLASYGSMAMYHFVAVTPEAPTVKDGFGGADPKHAMTITDDDIERVYASYAIKDRSPNLIVFSAPQLSLYELQRLAELLEGKRLSEGASMIVTTNSGYKAAAERLGYLNRIEAAGGIVLEGLCFYVLDGVARMREENGWENLVTNSAKLANIIAAHRYNPVLRRTEDCIEIATTGRLR